jgi:hypothetical protein
MKLPKAKMLRKFLYWMEERQRIYLKRQAGEPWPWTKDLLLKRFRFCNVYREQDKVTQWLRENWREPYKDHNNLWFATCLARQINWIPTLAEIGFPTKWDPRKVLRMLEARKKRGEQIYSGAYILGGGNTKNEVKTRYTIMTVLNPLWRKVSKAGCSCEDGAPPWGWYNKGCEHPSTLQETFEWLLTFHGFGKFLAYEVVTDLRHTRYLEHASDIMTWANAGPGAQRGLNRLYERELKQSHPSSQLLEEMLMLMEWVLTHRDPILLPTLEVRDIEMSLCEIDKYLRCKERMEREETIGLERFRPPSLI